MATPNYVFQLVSEAVAGAVPKGYAMVKSASGYVVSDVTARAGVLRSSGIAVGPAGINSQTIMQAFADAPTSLTGLTANAVGTPIRVGDTGKLERRPSPVVGDDVVGWAEPDGTAHLCFGVLPYNFFSGGGGGATPGGSGDILTSNGSGGYGSSLATIPYSKMGTGAQLIGAQTFSSTVDSKGTEISKEPVNVQTTDATVTTLDSFAFGAINKASGIVTFAVSAVKSDGSQAALYVLTGGFRLDSGGTVHQVGSTVRGVELEDDATWDASIDVDGLGNIRCRVTGKAATTIRWSSVWTFLQVVP